LTETHALPETKRGTDSLEDPLFPGLVITSEQIF
jgi:hypothetical protein